MGKRHFHLRSRFPDPRIERLSARTARDIGPVSLFRFQSFEICAGNRICRHSSNESHIRISSGERCVVTRSVELAIGLKTVSLRSTLCRSGYVLKRSSKILHHRGPKSGLDAKSFQDWWYWGKMGTRRFYVASTKGLPL